MLEKELKDIFLKEILDKKQINGISDEFILERLEKYLLTNGKKFKILKEHINKKGVEKLEKNKNFKEIIKSIKNEIGIVYGSFQTKDFNKKEKILNNISSKEEIEKILFCHKSSRERKDFYEIVYKEIFKWYEPTKIGDIACGLNPLTYFYLPNKNIEYIACDLNQNDMNFLNNFFNKFKIKGVAKAYDVTNLKILEDKDIQNCDLIFLFKALDSFETLKKNISKDLILGLKAKNIVVSFPTRSLVSKIEFKKEKRNWFYKFLKDNKFNFKEFEIDNEMFILISK